MIFTLGSLVALSGCDSSKGGPSQNASSAPASTVASGGISGSSESSGLPTGGKTSAGGTTGGGSTRASAQGGQASGGTTARTSAGTTSGASDCVAAAKCCGEIPKDTQAACAAIAASGMSLDCSLLLAAQRSLGYCLEPGVSAPLPAVALDGAWGDRAVVNLGTTSFPLPLQAVACGNKGALALIGANNGSLWGTRLVPTGPGAWEKAVSLADANAGTSAWMAGIGADGTCQGTAVWAEIRGKQNILRYTHVDPVVGFGTVQSGESAAAPSQPYAGFRVVQGQTGDAEVGYYWPSPTGSPSIRNTDVFTTRTVQKAGTLSDPIFHNTFELAGGQLAELRDGRVLAVYVEGNKAQYSDSFTLMFIERTPTGAWSAPRALLTSPAIGLLAVVPAGDRIYAILGQAGLPARLLQILPGATTLASDQAAPAAVPLGSQSTVAASGNTFHVAWIDQSNPPLLQAARWVEGSGWTQPENVGAAGYLPLHVTIVADAKQRVTLVFDTTDTKNPVLLGNRFVPGTGWLGVHQIETDDSHSAKVLAVDSSENVLLMYSRFVSTTGFVYARWYTPNP